MCIFEFDEEKFLKSEREYAFREGQESGKELGREEGIKEGIKEGEDRLSMLLQFLMNAGRSKDIPHVISDREYRERLYQEQQLTGRNVFK